MLKSKGTSTGDSINSTAMNPAGQNIPAEIAARIPTAFADSHLWCMQREYYERNGLTAWHAGLVPHYITSNPSMAKAYADVVLGFWRDLKAQYGTQDQPLYIIELGAGCGRFAYHFLLQFFETFNDIRDPDDRFCYVMTDFSVGTVANWQSSIPEKLKPFVDLGYLDYAVFDVEKDGDLYLQQERKVLCPGSLRLPPVVIANYVFSGIRQDLFFLEKERMYEGWLTISAREEQSKKSARPERRGQDGPGEEFACDFPLEDLELSYQRRRISATDYANPQWNQLIERYAQFLPPCALLFPSYALPALDRLANLARGNLLLLRADRGCQDLTALAAQKEPDIAFHGSCSFPVNFHALDQLIRAQDGLCVLTSGEELTICSALWQASDRKDWRETSFAMKQLRQQFNPNDFFRVKQLLEEGMEDLDFVHMLAFLRLSHWDTKVFYLLYPQIVGRLTQLTIAQQHEWRSALLEVWRYHLPIGEDYDLPYDLALLAAELHRWRDAVYFLGESLKPSDLQQQVQCSIYFNLGIAHWQMAMHTEADSYLERAAILAPHSEAPLVGEVQEASQSEVGNVDDETEFEEEDADDDDLEDPIDASALSAISICGQLNDLRTWQVYCQKKLGAQILSAEVSPPQFGQVVYATLLGPHHASALYRLQGNPGLAESAGIECLYSTEHARDWIVRAQSEHKYVLAIVHPDFGLIGVTGLECSPFALSPQGSRSARFYYWIGEEFQCGGYGTQAMQLLHQLTAQLGIQDIFSTVAESNGASQRVLAKLGYRRLPFALAGERNSCRFYHSGQTIGEERIYAALDQFLLELESKTTLAPLTPASGSET